MDKKFRILIIYTAILVLSFVGTASATNWSVDDDGGADFTGIQDAINKASTGDSILVYYGVYYENVVVNKSVTLKGFGHATVDARRSGSVITLTADGITVEGFNVTNSGGFGSCGISVFSNHNNIIGNTISNDDYGIYLHAYSRNNTITGNSVCNNDEGGIHLYDSSNNTITGNTVRNNRHYGIYLKFSSNNNTITGNVFVNDGLSVYGAYQNTVKDNKVNGKPLVYLEDVSDYKVENAGQVILVNCNNITVENLDLSDTHVGIGLWEIEDSTISNNRVCNNSGDGIRLCLSRNNIITGNTVCSNSGISLYSSSNNNITGNNVSNNAEGIDLIGSSNNTITGNNVSNNRYGISLSSSSKNTITGNNASNNRYGIALWSSRDNTFTDNTVCYNDNEGICLSSSSNNVINGNTFVNDGLFLYDSYQNTVESNTVNDKLLVYLEDASDYKVEDAGQVILVNCNNITVKSLDLSNTSVGIELWGTVDSIISNNKVCNNRYGIRLESSRSNTITGNTICKNRWDGIHLESSSNNTISGNTVCNSRHYGIRLESSRSNTITSNTFVNDGLFVQESHQNRVEDNIVNGKPLVYLEYVSNYKVEDAGQVILLNCSNITVENQDLTNISVGIVLLGTEGSIISNNTVSNNSLFGIHLKSSSSNTISGNTVCYNDDDGIRLVSSRNSTISGNTVCYNDDDGIRLDSSCNSTITGNTICNNRLGGIGLFHSSNSTIAANNVCNNSGGITLSYSSNNNTITSNTFVNDGLFVYDSYQNRVEDNRVNSKPLVYLEDVSNYKVEDTGQVILVNCNNITVENLDLSDTYVGIGLWETEDSTISNNRVCNNSYGIDLFFSSNNTITGNTICNNYDDCIFLLYSSNNKIYLNNFINNSYNFYSEESTNIWNSKGKITYTHNGSTFTNYLGNYWSNYKEKYPDGEGIDGTGILDTPYSINSDKDNYPLMEPWENYFIYPVVSPEKVEINTKVEAGETVIHYENRSFWKESDLLKILENKEEFESTMIENFNEDLSKYCKKREYAADVEFEEARKLTVFKCEVHNAITKSDNMYRATFIWLLRPLGLDFIDDNFEKTKDGLSREGTINNIPTNISLIFPPQKSVYAAWQHPIGHCHAHVWWIVYVFE